MEYLAELARIELKEKNEEKLLKDLQKILEYFEELKEVDTEKVEPLAGGTIEYNVFRKDEKIETSDKGQATRGKLVEAFSKEENGYLKIPPVFE